MVGIWIGNRNKQLHLISCQTFIRHYFLRELFSCMLRNKRADGTSYQDKDDGGVEHLFGEQVFAIGQHNRITNHHGSECTRCMGIGQTKHQLTLRSAQAHGLLRNPCRQPFHQYSGSYHKRKHLNRTIAISQHAYINQHTYTQEENRNKQRIPHKIDAVHQGREIGYLPIERQRCKENAKNGFESGKMRQATRCGSQNHHKEELHHGVVVPMEKPPRQTRHYPEDTYHHHNRTQR